MGHMGQDFKQIKLSSSGNNETFQTLKIRFPPPKKKLTHSSPKKDLYLSIFISECLPLPKNQSISRKSERRFTNSSRISSTFGGPYPQPESCL